MLGTVSPIKRESIFSRNEFHFKYSFCENTERKFIGVLRPEKLSKPNNSYEPAAINGANAAAAT